MLIYFYGLASWLGDHGERSRPWVLPRLKLGLLNLIRGLIFVNGFDLEIRVYDGCRVV